MRAKAMTTNELHGWEQTKAIWRDKDNRFFYRILGGVALVGIGVVIGFGLFQTKEDRSSYVINAFTSVLSISITVFVLDLLAQRREEKREERELKARLIQ